NAVRGAHPHPAPRELSGRVDRQVDRNEVVKRPVANRIMSMMRKSARMPNVTYASVGCLPYFRASSSDRIANTTPSGQQQTAPMMPSTPQSVVLSLAAAAGGGA